MHRLFRFLMLTALACTGPLSHSTGEFDLSGLQDVTGSQINTHVTDSGEVLQPVDLSATPISAFVRDQFGQFTVYPGTGAEDGTFSVPGVPASTYTLRVGARYFVVDARNIDLGTTILGRPDRIPATISPTNLVLDLTDLRPWTLTDLIFFNCSNVGTFGIASPTSGIPNEGDTSTDSFTFDYVRSSGTPFLVDAKRNDRLILVQYVDMPAPPGMSVRSASTATVVPPFSQVDGVSTRIAATMGAVPATERLGVNWPHSAFTTFGPMVNPRAESFSANFIAVAQPSRSGKHFIGANLANVTPIDFRDIDVQISYGTPYPSDWNGIAQVQERFRLMYQLDGSLQPLVEVPVLFQTHELSSVDGTPILPISAPVQNASIEGVDAFVDQTGISATPTLRWDEPSTGPATEYRIVVHELFLDPGTRGTRSRQLATLSTQDTSLTIPPGVLSSGLSYYFRIRTIKTPQFDPARPLDLLTLPDAFFEVYTNKVSIQ